MGSLLLVGLSGGVVLGLIDLVGDGIAGGVEAVWREESQCTSQEEDADAEEAGRECLPGSEALVVVLGDLLVGLLGSTAGGALDLVGDVVGSGLDGIHFEGWCLV